MDETLRVHCPLYLVTSSEACWKCSRPQSVVALGTHCLMDGGNEVGESADRSDLILLTNITSMPFEIFKYIAQRNYRYMKRHSRTAGETYYANTCECGANFGDFYLYSEPGGAFFPDTDDTARAIRIHELPFTGLLEFECSYSQGGGEYILSLGQRDAA